MLPKSFRANLGHPTTGFYSALPAVAPFLRKTQVSVFWSESIFGLNVLCSTTQFVSLNSWNKKWVYQILFCWECGSTISGFCQQTLFLDKTLWLNSLGKNSLDLGGEQEFLELVGWGQRSWKGWLNVGLRASQKGTFIFHSPASPWVFYAGWEISPYFPGLLRRLACVFHTVLSDLDSLLVLGWMFS